MKPAKRHKTANNSLQVRIDDLIEYGPITKNQEVTYDAQALFANRSRPRCFARLQLGKRYRLFKIWDLYER